jgi:hypothetical protein
VHHRAVNHAYYPLREMLRIWGAKDLGAVAIKVLKTASCLNSSEKEKAAAANKRPGGHVHGSNLALPRTEMLAQRREAQGRGDKGQLISHQKISLMMAKGSHARSRSNEVAGCSTSTAAREGGAYCGERRPAGRAP